MSEENLIQINTLCKHYQVEMSFFSDLQEFGFIEIQTVEDTYFVHEDKIYIIEKIIRMQDDLNINLEGVDTVLNLLEKIDDLETELKEVKNRLRLYED